MKHLENNFMMKRDKKNTNLTILKLCQTSKVVYYFPLKLHLRCVTGVWKQIRLKTQRHWIYYY